MPTGDALGLLSGLPSFQGGAAGPSVAEASSSGGISAPFTVGGAGGLSQTTLLIFAAIAGLTWILVKKL